MYPGIAVSVDSQRFANTDKIEDADSKSRPERSDETLHHQKMPARCPPPHGVQVRGFGETPGTLRDNQVDAPLDDADSPEKEVDSGGGTHVEPLAPRAGADRDIKRSELDARGLAPLLAVSAVIGQRVFNPEGVAMGTICELMYSTHSGAIAYAILSISGGALGKETAITSLPWKTLRFEQPGGKLIYDLSARAGG